jgi:hypothetical protein
MDDMNRWMARKTRALLVMLSAVAAVAVTTAPATARADDTARQQLVIECQVVNADLPNVLGLSCDTDVFGPIEDFIIQGPINLQRYHCESGFAHGRLWVVGSDCQWSYP